MQSTTTTCRNTHTHKQTTTVLHFPLTIRSQPGSEVSQSRSACRQVTTEGLSFAQKQHLLGPPQALRSPVGSSSRAYTASILHKKNRSHNNTASSNSSPGLTVQITLGILCCPSARDKETLEKHCWEKSTLQSCPRRKRTRPSPQQLPLNYTSFLHSVPSRLPIQVHLTIKSLKEAVIIILF